MSIIYEVREIVNPLTGKRTGRYKNTRSVNAPRCAPFLFCDHKHSTIAEAEACRDFGSDPATEYHFPSPRNRCLSTAIRLGGVVDLA